MNISLSKPKCYKRLIWDLYNVDESGLLNALSSIHWDDVFVDVDEDDVDNLYNKCLIVSAKFLRPMCLIELLLFALGTNRG